MEGRGLGVGSGAPSSKRFGQPADAQVAPTDDLYILGDFSYQMTAVEAEASRRCAAALRELGLGR
jgi:hypothetical protein